MLCSGNQLTAGPEDQISSHGESVQASKLPVGAPLGRVRQDAIDAGHRLGHERAGLSRLGHDEEVVKD